MLLYIKIIINLFFLIEIFITKIKIMLICKVSMKYYIYWMMLFIEFQLKIMNK